MYKEGNAVIKYTKDSFLNREARISRDISVAFISNVVNKKTSIIDTTAATGIRGIRYYLETLSKEITFLEINKKVFGSLKKNVSSNKIKARLFNQSIQQFANNQKDKFDIIDLDPFGGITPYIYDLMKISRGGAYLLITATDMAVLCGADYKACVRLYDARPMHNELCKEVALRILIGYVTRIAAQFNFGVEVLISFSYMHYMRVFIRLDHGSKSSLESIKKLGYAYYCGKCGYRDLKSSFFPSMKNCPSCRSELEISGKLWSERLNDKRALDSTIETMINGAKKGTYEEEGIEFLQSVAAEIDAPLYYSIPKLTRRLGIGAVSDTRVIEMLAKKGFAVSSTHLEKATIKTDASVDDILKCIKTISKGY